MPAHLVRLTLPLLLTALALGACGPTEAGPDEQPRPSRPRDGGTPVPDAGSPAAGDAGSNGREDAGSPSRDGGTPPPSCTPSCTGQECGDNGCGGSCGTCSSGERCTDGLCACVPRCDGRQCGPDGCGGTCGSCGSGSTCSASGACVCVPLCQGKSCGPDGCGGSCGTCPSNSTCTASGETCGCDVGYVPDAASESCVRIGGPCQGVSEYGHCAGDSWVRCDAQAGVVVVPCGAGQCKTVDSQGTGACRCGSIDANGVCASEDGTSTARPNTHFVCATALGILMAENCGARTGSSAGLCSTFVTSAGHVTSCFCDTCTLGAGGACRPLCSNPNACRYYSAGNFHTCGF